jgi:hypothetical protein
MYETEKVPHRGDFYKKGLMENTPSRIGRDESKI